MTIEELKEWVLGQISDAEQTRTHEDSEPSDRHEAVGAKTAFAIVLNQLENVQPIRPIEEAPRDGTEVGLVVKADWSNDGLWYSETGLIEDDECVGWVPLEEKAE